MSELDIYGPYRPTHQLQSPPRTPEELQDLVLQRRLAAARRKETAAPFDVEIERLTALRDDTVAFWDVEIRHLDLLIERGHRQLWADHLAPQTWTLPHGKLTIGPERKGTLVIADEDRALAWAEANLPDAVKTTRVIDKAKLRQLTELVDPKAEPNSSSGLRLDDEVVPGVRVDFAERSYKIGDAE